MCLDFADDPSQYLVQVTGQGVVGQVDIANRLVNRFVVEKFELLLIAQHLQRRLTEDGKKQRRTLRRSQGKHHLVRQGSFATPWRAGDQVERKLRQASAQDLVQSWHTSGQTVDSHFGIHDEVSCAGVSLKELSQTGCNRRTDREDPMNEISSSFKVFSKSSPYAVAVSLVCCASRSL